MDYITIKMRQTLQRYLYMAVVKLSTENFHETWDDERGRDRDKMERNFSIRHTKRIVLFPFLHFYDGWKAGQYLRHCSTVNQITNSCIQMEKLFEWKMFNSSHISVIVVTV